MGRKLRYLTLGDRETIERLHKGGAPAAVIAATVKVHQATIYRELPNGYTYTGPPDEDGRPTPTVDEYCEMRDKWKIDAIKVGYDRALAGYWVEEMKANGFEMEPVAQGPYTWSQPMREMGAALEGKQVNYNGNPVLVWCLTNTGVKKSGLNNIQPVKITEKRRIDGMVSMLNAWVIYVKYYDDFMYSVG